VEVIDGHDFDAIDAAMNTAKTIKGQPCAIVMRTVKGKDVSFMENNAGWHGVAPNDAQYEQAMAELKAKLAELEGM
jgi:transketolase